MHTSNFEQHWPMTIDLSEMLAFSNSEKLSEKGEF